MAEPAGKVFVRDATGLTRSIGSSEAFLGNILAMGVSYFFVFAWFASFLFPGANLPVTVFVTLIPGVVVALLYYLFTVAMPRTGGDYVWTSRILTPSVGFMTNLLLTFTWLSSIATAVAWGVSYGLGPSIAADGLVHNNPGLVRLGTTIASAPDAFVLSIVLIALFIAPLFIGTKISFAVMWAAFAVALVGTIVTIVVFSNSDTATFAANFNQYSGGMNYTGTIKAVGLPSGFGTQATIFGSIFTMTNFLGFFSSSYFAGEVKRIPRSQVIAMFGSLIFLMVIAFGIYASAYHAIGSDFMNAISISSISTTPGLTYTLPAVPVLNFLIAFANTNPYVIIVSGLALLATGLGGATLFAFVCVRNLFAWSFDRVAPEGFTRLDSKRGTPYVAVALILAISIIFSAVYYYTPFFTYYIYGTLALFIVFIMVSFAAIFFPFRMKGVFESAPSFVRKRVGGFPLISIIGIVGVIVNAYFGYATVQPSVTPLPTGTFALQLISYATVPLVIVSAFVIYAVSYYYRKSKGLNLSVAFREIPPE